MPYPTPFHPRTSALCHSYRWKEWAGYYAVCSYDSCHEPEYMAFRHSAGLLDVTPLYKYDVTGSDAAQFLARVMVRDIRKLKVGQVTYCCWCDDAGKVLDDGTVTRLEEDHYRVTAAQPTGAWLERHSRGFAVRIEDVSRKVCVLAIQGPTSRDVLKAVSDADLGKLRFFRAAKAKVDGAPVVITRTGYTGDLGYEIWTENDHALKLYDALMAGGRPFGLEPAGLDALDVARIEAGFILLDVDYYSARDCIIEPRKTSPYEIGLEWTVNLEREPFIGQKALKAEVERGSPRAFVGLHVDWEQIEALFDRHNLPPQVPSGAWRTPTPVYRDGEQVGRASSGTWSPILKKNLALATVAAEHAKPGTELEIETTVEFARRTVRATVVPRPFFDPPRKKA